MTFLSISIDLAESTLIKQQMTSSAQGDRFYLKSLYDRYASLMFAMERELYTALSECRMASLEDLYLVKTIGDEYWYTYELPDVTNDRHRTANVTIEIIDALIRLSSADRFLSMAPPNSNGDAENHEFIIFDIPIKVFIDVIEEANEVNRLRYQHLKDILLSSAGNSNGLTYQVDQRFLDVCHRLNVGSGETASGNKNTIAVRDDFIGLEVDRFFRLTKFCHAGMITLGENLMRCLDIQFSDLSSELDHIPIKSCTSSDTTPALSCFVLEEKIKEGQMKGVSGGYGVYHLFNGMTLGESIYASPRYVKPLLAPTRGFLAEHGFYAIDKELIFM